MTRIVNIHEAKTHLSRLIVEAMEGKSFIIAKSGKPLVKVEAISPPLGVPRIGFLTESLSVPDDFDTLHQDEIIAMFGNDQA
jgi:prevent-host-death family protein